MGILFSVPERVEDIEAGYTSDDELAGTGPDTDIQAFPDWSDSTSSRGTITESLGSSLRTGIDALSGRLSMPEFSTDAFEFPSINNLLPVSITNLGVGGDKRKTFEV
jgi:hypothetical protein